MALIFQHFFNCEGYSKRYKFIKCKDLSSDEFPFFLVDDDGSKFSEKGFLGIVH